MSKQGEDLQTELQRIEDELQQVQATVQQTDPAPEAQADPAPEAQTYPSQHEETLIVRVRPGETMAQVASRTRRSISAIERLNPRGATNGTVRIPL